MRSGALDWSSFDHRSNIGVHVTQNERPRLFTLFLQRSAFTRGSVRRGGACEELYNSKHTIINTVKRQFYFSFNFLPFDACTWITFAFISSKKKTFAFIFVIKRVEILISTLTTFNKYHLLLILECNNMYICTILSKF